MGLFIRKAIKVGPLRFNLSKSGIGVSAGIRGLRLGTGPRGNYVHMGRGGLYYRKSLGVQGSSRAPSPSSDEATPGNVSSGDVQMHEIESASISALTDSSSTALLEEIREKKARVRVFPFALAAVVIALVVVLAYRLPLWIDGLFALCSVAGLGWIWWKDDLRKSVVLFYEFDDAAESALERLHEWIAFMVGSSRLWHVVSTGDVHDRKYHAGASTLIRRSVIKRGRASIPFIKTNVEIPTIDLRNKTLAFFPERLLILERSEVGAVSYSDLTIAHTSTRFIEDGPVPADSEVIDYTWKYVNKKGGPDRRFKDNRQLPILRYEELNFTSSTGLNEVVQVSRVGVGEGLSGALRAVSEIGSRAQVDPAAQ